MPALRQANSIQPPLTPRSGLTLRVLGIARISTEHQDRLSLDDQEALYRRWLDQHAGQAYDLKMIAGRGSGECLDRQEALQASTEVESGSYDLVIAEDLGRIFRRVHALLFCELCEDVGTRLVALNDHVDTGREDWRLLASFASMRHEMYNADTSKRIRRSLRNRFEQGGVVQTTVFGYVKPVGAKTDAELQKDPDAEAIFAEVFRLLEGGASYAEVADWLNDRRVPLPPYARSTRWMGPLVAKLIHNPILKGIRVRNKKMTKRVNQTGRRKSVAAPPSERLERHCPHLAFIDPLRYDRLIQTLDARNARFRRRSVDGVDPRKDVPTKRTVWPGQHIYCGVCGRMYVYGGHGQTDHLMCRGAHDYRCWNAITVDSPLAAREMIAAIRAEIAALPDFDPVVVGLVKEALREQRGSEGQKHQELARRLANVEREIRNVVAALREAGHSEALVQELKQLEKEKNQIAWEQQELDRTRQAPPTFPTMSELRALTAQAFDDLAVTSAEFGRLLRRLIPRIVVHPYRLCDGGTLVLRAHFTFSLAPLLPRAPGLEGMARALERSLCVDIFDKPQREAYRLPIMELTANGLKQRDIAWELELTQPTVQRAVALDRQMAMLGISDPYVPLLGPPADNGRLRRYNHRRYRFEPLTDEGTPPPPVAT